MQNALHAGERTNQCQACAEFGQKKGHDGGHSQDICAQRIEQALEEDTVIISFLVRLKAEVLFDFIHNQAPHVVLLLS